MKNKFIGLLVVAYLQGCSHLSLAPSREVPAQEKEIGSLQVIEERGAPENESAMRSGTCEKIARRILAVVVIAALMVVGLARGPFLGRGASSPVPS